MLPREYVAPGFCPVQGWARHRAFQYLCRSQIGRRGNPGARGGFALEPIVDLLQDEIEN